MSHYIYNTPPELRIHSITTKEQTHLDLSDTEASPALRSLDLLLSMGEGDGAQGEYGLLQHRREDQTCREAHWEKLQGPENKVNKVAVRREKSHRNRRQSTAFTVPFFE